MEIFTVAHWGEKAAAGNGRGKEQNFFQGQVDMENREKLCGSLSKLKAGCCRAVFLDPWVARKKRGS